MSLGRRKRIELEAKIGGLRRELDTLESLSRLDEKDRQPGGSYRGLAENSRQIIELKGMIGGVLDAVDATVERAAGDSTHGPWWTPFENVLLDVHRVYGYFRDKLGQREMTVARDILLLGDDFAYDCYKPVLNYLADADPDRPPPLVCFDDGLECAYSLGRGIPFDVFLRLERSAAATLGTHLARPGADAPAMARLRDVLKQLPFPVIALPWFALGHLPDLMLIAHELGHVVAADLGLDQDRLRDIVSGAVSGDDACERWTGWAEEVFADVYATLGGGAAYGFALADALALTADVWSPTRTYPAPDLRIRLVAAVLDRKGCPDDAEELRQRWDDEWGPGPSGVDLDRSILGDVVGAFLDARHERLSGWPLSELDGFDLQSRRAWVTHAAWHLQHRSAPQLQLPTAAPTLLAATSRLFATNPAVYAERGDGRLDVPTWTLELARTTRTAERRGGTGRHAVPAGRDETVRADYCARAREFLMTSQATEPTDRQLRSEGQ